VGPRVGLTGIMAAATILAASVLGLAWAQGGNKDRDKPRGQGQGNQATQPAPKAPDATATGARPVTRTVGNATVSVDPVTGRLQPPTPEEAAKLTAALYKMVSRETENLVVIQNEDGSRMASLDDAFQEVAMATRDRKGNVRVHCVNTPAQAERLLSGAEDKGPIYNSKVDRKAAKKGGHNAPAPAETE
jgi:hypothetical protein